MARAALTLTLIALLLGCSSAPAPQTEPDDVRYLRGIESIYSMRLDRLPDHDLLEPDTAMRNGLIAGDARLYLTAAVFRCGQVFTLDLLVINHTGTAVRVGREDLFLIDAQGQLLEPVRDWEGAAELGLRGRRGREKDLAGIIHELPEQDPDPSDRWASSRQFSGAAAAGPEKENRVPDYERRRGTPADDYGTATGLVGQIDPDNPGAIEIPADQGAAFWGYFRGRKPSMPLRAVVTLRDRQMVFEFDD